MISMDYTKFRWFFTSSGLLVIGGKSAEQNEEIVKITKPNSVMLHTSSPGSPFCIIFDTDEGEKDIKEAAIFCAALSKDWKLKKKSIVVDIFRKIQVYKTKSMAKGTFGIKGKTEKISVIPKLYLAFQEGKLRAVPFETDIAEITPGKLSKEESAEIIRKKLGIPKDEIMSALPSEGIELKWL
jgi:hypothetical protein